MIWIYLGAFLNLVGTCVAGVALVADYREHADGVPMFPRVTAAFRWVRQKIRPRSTSATISAQAAGATMTAGFAQVRLGLAEDASNEELIRWLRNEVDNLHELVNLNRRHADETIESLRSDIAIQNTDTSQQLSVIRQDIKGLATASTRQQLWGLLLVALGTLISLVPSISGQS